MFSLKADNAHIQRLCVQTVKSVITAGLPADSDIYIKGLINVIVNNTDVIIINFNDQVDGGSNPMPPSPSNNINMGTARRSLVNSLGTPTRRGRPTGFSPSTYSPRGRGVTSPRTPRGMAPRGRVMTPRGRVMTPGGRGIGVPSMQGAINITPQHNMMPNSNVGGTPKPIVSNGGVIEIDDDDGPAMVKKELPPPPAPSLQLLTSQTPQHLPTQPLSHMLFSNQNMMRDIKPVLPTPFAEELGCSVHMVNPKQESRTSNGTQKRPNDEAMSHNPPEKQQRTESNLGSDLVFKIESESNASQSPQSADAFKCPLCAKTFQFRSWFEKHLLGHENKGDLVSGACDGVVKQLISCRYCPKRFKYQTDLDNHMGSHIKESFKCNSCGKNYSSRKQLMDHMDREHQGNGPVTSTSGQTLDPQALGLE